jgi:hypothetical protein
MAIYGAVGDAPKVRNGKRRGVSAAVYDNVALSAGTFVLTNLPFRTILAVDAMANETTIDGAGLGTSTFTWNYVPSTGTLTIYGWRPTSSANPTLIAANTATPFSAIVWGLY